MNSWRRLVLLSVVLAGTVSCDQATKQLAISGLRDGPGHSFLGGFFQLGYAENPGAFLSLFGGLSPQLRFWLLTGGVGTLLLAMIVYALRNRQLTRLQFAGFALFAGGGVSNWLDRVFNDGRVVDFMLMGIGPLRTGVFNVADVAILAGVGLFLLPSRTMFASSTEQSELD